MLILTISDPTVRSSSFSFDVVNQIIREKPWNFGVPCSKADISALQYNLKASETLLVCIHSTPV